MTNRPYGLLQQAPWLAEHPEEQLAKACKHSLVLIVRGANGQRVGFLRAIRDQALVTYLCDLFVDEAHRRQGIGTRLMERLLEHPQVRNTTVVLLTQGAEDFYRKFGFVERTAMVRRPDAEG